MYEYKAKVMRVVDGDTIDVEIDLGFTIKVFQRLRFAGIDAPETRTRDKLEKAKGFEAKKFVEDEIAKCGGYVMIRTGKTGKFGRYIADIRIDMSRDRDFSITTSLNSLMVSKGYAVKKEY